MRAAAAFVSLGCLSGVGALLPTRAGPAGAIDAFARRCVKQEAACMDTNAAAASFGALASFRAVDTLPLPPSSWDIETSELEKFTGLPRNAFQPTAPRPKLPATAVALQDQPQTAAFAEPSAQLAELSVAASMLVGAALGLRVSALDALHNLNHFALSWLPVTCGVCVGTTLSIMLLESLLKGGSSARTLRSAEVREAVVRHEAGHFLTCILLGVPVAAVHVHSWRSLLGAAPAVTFVSPELLARKRGEACSGDDVDRLSVILMAGVAAEALHRGAAEGGFADEGAIARLLASQPARSHVPPQQHARWAAANAVVLLRTHSEAYEAVCDALRSRKSVGECCAALDGAFASAAAADRRLQPDAA